MVKFDNIDKKIVNLINQDWEMGVTKMGEKVKLSHTALRARLKRLNEQIIDVECSINFEKLGLKLFMICLEARHKNEVVHHAKNCPKILKYYDSYGEYNFIMLCVAENSDTMESMIDNCFSMNFTDITKYTVIKLSSNSFPHQNVKFFLEDEKKSFKCDFKTKCVDCESLKLGRCMGCPLNKEYKGIL